MSAVTKHLTAAVIVWLCCLPAVAQKPRVDTAELMRLETVWNEAHVRSDANALDRLWAEDLVITISGMPIMNKAESLAVARSGRIKFHSYKTSDIRIRVYDNAAVVTGQLERVRSSAAHEFEDDWRFTKVYVRRQGRWQVVAWHASPVA